MSIAHLIGILLVGLVAGWLAGTLMRGRGFGLLGNILVGIVGAFIGSHLFSYVGLAAYGVLGQIIMALVGALVLLFLIGLIRKA